MGICFFAPSSSKGEVFCSPCRNAYSFSDGSKFEKKKDNFLDFLAIETIKMPDNNYEMKITFAGDSIIRIIAEVIEVTLDDQGEAWDTKNKPKHQVI